MSENNSNHKNLNGNGHKPKRAIYSDKQIANALTILKSCNGNVLQASRESGVPRKTLERWAKGMSARVSAPEVAEDMAAVRHISQDQMIASLESLIMQILEAAPGKIADAPFGQTMTGYGIATDKWRLLQDKPTAITGTVDVAAEAYARWAKIPLEEAKAAIIEVVERVN